MQGLTFQEFYNAIFFGADIDMQYKNMYYHISSGKDDRGEHCISVYQYDRHPDFESSFYKEIYNEQINDSTASVENMMRTPIFDGNIIYNIEKETVIIYS